MKTLRTAVRLLVVLGTLVLSLDARAASVVLYSNDFEPPNQPVEINCPNSLDTRGINFLYGTDTFVFHQTYTVEAVVIEDSIGLYSDPEDKGGSIALGMLSSAQNDLLALTFNREGLEFLNVGLDLSSIDVSGCGGPFGVAAPVMQVSLLDSPGGVFAFGQTVLDTATITGEAAPDRWTFHWTAGVAALDASAATDYFVSVLFDLTQSGYAAFDNLSIVASDEGGVVDSDLDGIADDTDNCRSPRTRIKPMATATASAMRVTAEIAGIPLPRSGPAPRSEIFTPMVQTPPMETATPAAPPRPAASEPAPTPTQAPSGVNPTETPASQATPPVTGAYQKPPQSQAAEIRPSEMRTTLTDLSAMIGLRVLDANGGELGLAGDYIVNTCETYLLYILMEPAVGLAVDPGGRVVIPNEALTVNSGLLDAQARAIQLRLAPEQLAGAPVLPPGVQLIPTDWEAAVREFWSKAVRIFRSGFS